MTGDHLGALWKYRQLVWTIAWGDFKWRYKNSILGYFWSLLEPLIMFIILYIVFSNLMRVQVEYYQLFLLLGIIMWNFFTKATNLGLNAIVGKPSLIQRVYFPRDVLVIAGVITAMLQSLFESVVFILFMVYFAVPLSWNILYLLYILVIYFMLALGVALGISALNVYYRDIQFIWVVILQAGFFITPILYPLSIFSPQMQAIFRLNPIAQIIVTSRDVILYSVPPYWVSLAYAGVASLIVFIAGYVIFLKLEPRFAEAM
ncbi:MAG TPA: ABC transporter permease [Methanomicrobiales archaeon]|nr:ABC transporter permease [Methanomicrobiales archaeon]